MSPPLKINNIVSSIYVAAVFFILICSVLIVSQARAHDNADFFNNRTGMSTNIPPIAGDPMQKDMFPTYHQSYVSSDKDLFDQRHDDAWFKQNENGVNVAVPTRTSNSYSGSNDMFALRPRPTPDRPIYHYNAGDAYTQ